MPEPQASSVLGRYQLLEPLAKGGMAEVFKARLAGAAGTEKLVCIKRILPHLARNQDFLSLFVKEAKIALPLTHGNITQVFDFGEEQGVYYLAMEYIAGQNLHALLKRVRETGGLLDIGVALHVASEVCKGLQYAHSFVDAQGRTQVVVHRDVTPHNVLISYNGEVKLTDFGIALAASAADDGVVRGKACYLSPEQAAGDPGTPGSDLFSLGAVLYEALTGLRLFEADTEADTLRRVRELEVEPPSRYNREVDESIDRIVMRALERDPAVRFARAGEMQVELAQALHRGWPGFTAASLATMLREHFAWELSQLEDGGATDGSARDRLLYQLSRAGVKVDPATSTAELLALGTVAISGAGVRPPRARRGRERAWLLAAVVALVAAGGIAAALLLRPPAASTIEEDDEPALLYQHGAAEPDHLAPPSAQAPAAAEAKAAPAAAAGSSQASARAAVRAVRKAAAAAGMGFLNCNSWPWSVVYLDGRRLHGNTPIFRVKVAAGRHHLRFVNPELSLSKEVEVQLEPGDVKTVAVSLQQ